MKEKLEYRLDDLYAWLMAMLMLLLVAFFSLFLGWRFDSPLTMLLASIFIGRLWSIAAGLFLMIQHTEKRLRQLAPAQGGHHGRNIVQSD